MLRKLATTLAATLNSEAMNGATGSRKDRQIGLDPVSWSVETFNELENRMRRNFLSVALAVLTLAGAANAASLYYQCRPLWDIYERLTKGDSRKAVLADLTKLSKSRQYEGRIEKLILASIWGIKEAEKSELKAKKLDPKSIEFLVANLINSAKPKD